MNPQRIEEFRRKLRSGQAARVRGGQVELEGATPAPAGAAPGNAAAGAGGSQAPQSVTPFTPGVQVKPHEWGAS